MFSLRRSCALPVKQADSMHTQRFSLTLTTLYAIALLLLFWFLFNPFKQSTELDNLRYIGASAGRMMERHLAFYEGYDEDTSIVERALHQFLFGTREHVQQQVLEAYEEVLTYLNQHAETATPWAVLNTRARWLITIAELKDIETLRNALQNFDSNPEEEVIAEAVKFAYLDDYEGFTPEIFTGVTLVPSGWAKDRLRWRINTRLGKPYFINLFDERLKSNGKRLREHVLQMAIAIAVVVLSGLFLMLRYNIFYMPSPWPKNILNNPWSFSDGLAVAIRSALFGLLIWLGLHLITQQFFRPNFFTTWSTLFASIPMLWYIHTYLLKPRGLNLLSGFGLNLNRFNVIPFLTITGALLSLEMIGLILIGWGTWQLGLSSHWSSGIQERLVFSSTDIVLLSVINIVIWTPIFEEIGFRGLFYTTLRARFTPTLAIVCSAIIFSAVHLKSLNGFLSIFWSGLILAYAYERYRSLLPGMVIHGAGNLLYLSTILLFYR